MKYYHIDRTGALNGISRVELFDDYQLEGNTELCQKVLKDIAELYPEGISEHGNRYIFDPVQNGYIESVFELVRLFKYPEKLSRFQAFFAVGEKQFGTMLKKLNVDQVFSVYEVSASVVERHDMSLLLGDSFALLQHYSEMYWEGEESDCPVYEYLMKPPVQIVRRLTNDEIQSILCGGKENA